jgi:hypothetical protein
MQSYRRLVSFGQIPKGSKVAEKFYVVWFRLEGNVWEEEESSKRGSQTLGMIPAVTSKAAGWGKGVCSTDSFQLPSATRQSLRKEAEKLLASTF